MTILGQIKAARRSAELIMGNGSLPPEKKAELLFDELQHLPFSSLKRNKKSKPTKEN